MNCPQCHQLVGNDQFTTSQWEDEIGERGTVIDVTRDIIIDCDHCGVFHVVQSADLHIRKVFQPSGDRAQNRLRSHLPNPDHVEAA